MLKQKKKKKKKKTKKQRERNNDVCLQNITNYLGKQSMKYTYIHTYVYVCTYLSRCIRLTILDYIHMYVCMYGCITRHLFEGNYKTQPTTHIHTYIHDNMCTWNVYFIFTILFSLRFLSHTHSLLRILCEQTAFVFFIFLQITSTNNLKFFFLFSFPL